MAVVIVAPDEGYAWVGTAPAAAVASPALFVGEDGQGSDSNPGTEGSPFATIQKAFVTAVAGDTIYLRGGIHTPSSGWNMKFGYNSGSSGNRIVVSSYPEERARIDASNCLIEHDRADFWTYENFEVFDSQTFVVFGEDLEVTDIIIRNIRGIMDRGGDNVGIFKMLSGVSAPMTWDMYNCWITGPGFGVNANTGCVWVTKAADTKIRNNIFHGTFFGLYFKHAQDPYPTSAGEANFCVENNLSYNTSRSDCNAGGSVYQNNIYGVSDQGIRTPEANGRPGGDYNLFDHNTHVDGNGLVLTDQTQSGDPGPIGSRFNTVSNNLLGARSPGTASNTLSFNNHFTGGAGGDTGSTTGTPVFVGGDSTLPSYYALTAGSPGKNAADDGSDMGADVSLVGPKKSLYFG